MKKNKQKKNLPISLVLIKLFASIQQLFTSHSGKDFKRLKNFISSR